MENKPDSFPIIGKTYAYFDDGKIKESRKLQCIITDIIPFDNIDEEILVEWREEIKDYDWIYSNETDYFIKADLNIYENEIEKIVFVRTPYNSWFSLGYWGGVLDIDGSLTKELEEIQER